MQPRMPTSTLEQADDLLTHLSRLGETRTWEPGTAVVREGEVADCMYLIHSGELRAVLAGEGARPVELNTLGPGEFFGELMLRGGLRAATVEVTVRDALAVVEQGLRVVPGPMSQARIAERLGASRAMVNRLLQDLARGGYIEVSRGRIVLLKNLPPRW